MSENILLNKNVLIAEDNALNQLVVKHTLLKLGASADIAPDGNEAIKKFKTNHYDLILMDIQMPVLDGYEATSYIRNQLLSKTPIIAMTAFALAGEDVKCFESGMNGYVSKPFTVNSLSNVIQQIMTVPTEINSNPYILTNKNVAVDLSMLYNISGNDESYIATMVQTFLENMPNTLKKIGESLETEDWDEVYRSAHFAKSSLSIIKISDMFDWILTIEKDARSRNNLSAIPPLFEKVKSKFAFACQVLEDKFGCTIKQQ